MNAATTELTRLAANTRNELLAKLNHLRQRLHEETVRLENFGVAPDLGCVQTMVAACELAAQLRTLQTALRELELAQPVVPGMALADGRAGLVRAAPCACGRLANGACVDCRTPVCDRTACRDSHERTCPAAPSSGGAR